MRKRVAGLLGCLLVLAMGSVARTQEGEWQPAQAQLTGDGKQLAAYFQHSEGRLSPRLVRWEVASGRILSQHLLERFYTPAPRKSAGPSEFYQDVVAFPAPQPWLLFSPDGALFCVSNMGMFSLSVSLFDATTGQALLSLELSNERVIPHSFSPDGKLLMGVSKQLEGTSLIRLKFWDTNTGKPVELLKNEHEGDTPATALFSQDNRLIVTIGRRLNQQQKSLPWVAVFDRHTGKQLNSFFLNENRRHAFELSPDGQMLATIPAPGPNLPAPREISLWSTQTGTVRQSLPINPRRSSDFVMRFSADSAYLSGIQHLSEGVDFFLQTWDTQTNRKLQDLLIPPPAGGPYDPWENSIFATNGHLLARSVNGDKFEVLSLDNQQVVRELKVESWVEEAPMPKFNIGF